MMMKKLFITLLIVGIASFMGYALLSGEHNFSDEIVADTTQAKMLHSEIVPATIPPFKGHRLQTLIDFSHELNAILFNRELTAERRAELLVAKGAPMSFDNLVAMVHDSDYAYYERCDGPCFDAIQDTIIRSYTDEILSDYWYYTEGADSVLMFDMEAFRRDYPQIFASEEVPKPNADNANVLQELQKEVEQFIAESAILPSYDGRYTAQLICTIHPHIETLVAKGISNYEGEARFKYGVRLYDKQTDTTLDLFNTLYQNGDQIDVIQWGLDSNTLYYDNGHSSGPSWGVYGYDIAHNEVVMISSGFLQQTIKEGKFKGCVEVITSYYAKEGGCYWYKAAISPDGKEKARLTEPSMDFPE